MSLANRINHKIHSGKWVRPQIKHDTWVKINSYARANDLDFPSAVEKAANLLTNAENH